MRNKTISKTIVLIMAVSLVLSISASAAVMGDYLTGYNAAQGAGMTLARGIYWTGSDYRNENYIEYTPNDAVKPMIVYGSKVTNYGSFSSMASLLEGRGYHVIAGINGDYYNMANYEPIGVVIYEGALMSSDSGYNAVGFKADGTAVIGRPSMKASLNIGGTDFALTKINKTRNASDFSLITEDYAPNTKSACAGWDVICTPSQPKLSLNCAVTLTVDEVRQTEGSIPIPAGKMLISVAGTAAEDKLNAVKALQPGDTVSLGIASAPEWQDVQFAVGSLYKLVTNGAVEQGLEKTNTTPEPRSAVGVKADGTMVLYTVDGRQSGYSVGASMKTVAERLLEMGCVEATVMDGGGSTGMNAIYLGGDTIYQVNKSSGGSQRSVTDYIVLATKNAPTGTSSQLAVYPLSTTILKGAQREFSALAADAYGYKTALPAGVSFNLSGDVGTLSQSGVFTAGKGGVGTVTVTAPGVSPASVQVHVIETPGSITVLNGGRAISSLSVKAGGSADLSAAAMFNHTSVLAADENFTWTLSGNIGSIDAKGAFTAAADAAEGGITVAAGGRSVTIPVSVTRTGSFDDVAPSAWYFDAAEYVSSMGYISGTAPRTFSPDVTVSRAMMATILWSVAGKPAAASAGFGDVAADKWYAPAVSWAQSTGVAAGYSDGTFRPDEGINREQMAAMLYKFQSVRNGAPAPAGDLGAYKDASAVSDWAKDAVGWCVSKGIISGMTADTIVPQGTANRAQSAVIIQKYMGA